MSVPKLRFRGFTEEWEKKKLGEITKRVKGNDGRMNLPTLTISAKNGWMRQEDRFSSNIAGAEQKNYTLLSKGELSYNHGNSKLAKYGVVYSLKHINEALVPKVYHSFKTTKFFYNLFIEYLFMSKIPDRELRKLISSGARMDGLLNIGYDEFMGINVILPEFEEQQKIGDFFMLLDKRIEQQEQKIALLKDYKKAMMQKIFSQKIRFKDENGNDYPDWEEKKFLNIFFSIPSRAYQIFKTEIFSNGKIPVVDQGKKKVAGYSNEIKKICDKTPCIVFGDHTTELKYIDFPFIIGADGTKILRNHIANSTLFLYYLLLENNVEQEGYKRHFSILTKKSFDIPMIKEQEKIASFLSTIDFNIEKQEGILENLKNQKGVLLHKMFI